MHHKRLALRRSEANTLADTLYESESQVGVLPSPAEALAGRDFCSTADFSTAEFAAVLELAHAVKARPRDYR